MADLHAPEELAAWREACAQATPGPWHADGSSFSTHECDGEEFTIGDVFSRVPDGEVEPDAAFIALARDALPRLLDAVEALRAECEARADVEEALCADLAERDRRIAELRATVGVLRGQVSGVAATVAEVVAAVESAAAPKETP